MPRHLRKLRIPTHSELAGLASKICNCRQCLDPEKHPCSRALWVATITLQLLEEMESD